MTTREITNFITKDECVELINEGQKHLSKMTTIGADVSKPNEFRIADGAWVNTDLTRKIKQRIADECGLPVENQEGFHIVRYKVGGTYKPHHDYFFEGEHYHKECTLRGGQRRFTHLIYLNDDFTGGGTSFPEMPFSVEPKEGKLLKWANTDEQGNPDPESLHTGEVVEEGEKWIAVVWTRLHKFNQPCPCEEGKSQIKRKVTEKGFELREMPQNLYDYLLEHVEETDRTNGEFVWSTSKTSGMGMYHLPPDKQQVLLDATRMTLREWSNEEISDVCAYGVREYVNGNTLAMHTDREETHHLSIIFVLDYDKEWPLAIIDHNGDYHEISIKKGQMLLYESAACEHGRPTPFEGEYFRNCFIHFSYDKGLFL